MLNKTQLISVTNRSSTMTGYVIPELGNLSRHFEANEVKQISMDELRRLSWMPGGKQLIEKYFKLDNQEAIDELLGNVEPEYFYTPDRVLELLTTGSEDELLDALDFAPEGVITMIKDTAVKIKLNDLRKRNIIREKTGFDVNSAIQINEETEKDNTPEVKERRTTKTAEKKTPAYTPVRRATKSE